MKHNLRIIFGVITISLLSWALPACQKRAPEQRPQTEGVEQTKSGDQPDRGDKPGEGTADSSQLARGEYLVKHVLACGDCHTPRNEQGQLDPGRFLAGTPDAPNLTPSKDGLGDWSADQIKQAVFYGKTPSGHILSSEMPYWAFQAARDEDADAVVAYLQTIPAVDNSAQKDGAKPHDHEAHDHDAHEHGEVHAAQPLRLDMMPETTLQPGTPEYQKAQQGKRLAIIANCASCHTESSQGELPVNADKLLAGGLEFRGILPSPPFPEVIVASNLTPDAHGIAGWTPQQVKRALQEGINPQERQICPPMPSGPHGAYAGMHDEDALALGHYLTTIPPVDNGELPFCTMPAGAAE